MTSDQYSDKLMCSCVHDSNYDNHAAADDDHDDDDDVNGDDDDGDDVDDDDDDDKFPHNLPSILTAPPRVNNHGRRGHTRATTLTTPTFSPA